MDAKLNQSDLISLLAKGSNISVAKAELFTKNFFDLIIEGLEQDGIVKINGLGTFKVTDVASRGSINVNTGEKIEIKGHKKLTFTPADGLKECVNQPFAMFEPVEVDDTYQPDTADDAEMDETTEPVENENTAEEIVETLMETPAETNESTVAELPAKETEEPAVCEEPVPTDVEEQIATPITEVEKSEELAIETETEPETKPVVVQERPSEPVMVHVPKKKSKQEQPVSPVKKRKGRPCITISVIIAFALGIILVNRMGRNGVANELAADVDANVRTEQVVAETPAEPVPDADVAISETVIPAEEAVAAEDVVAEDTYTFIMVDELAAKNLKLITLADTALYVADGLLTQHTVAQDETLTKIARLYYGDKRLWPYIVKYNRMADPNGLCCGMEIAVPRLIPRN